MEYINSYFTEFIGLWAYLVVSWLIAREYFRLWLINFYPKLQEKYSQKWVLTLYRTVIFMFAFLLPFFAIFDIMEYNGTMEKFKQFTKKRKSN